MNGFSRNQHFSSKFCKIWQFSHPINLFFLSTFCLYFWAYLQVLFILNYDVVINDNNRIDSVEAEQTTLKFFLL